MNLLNNSRIIDSDLFEVLSDSTRHVRKALTLMDREDPWRENYSEYLEKLALAKESLLMFMYSFYHQFFAHGYGLDVESLEDSADEINEIEDRPKGRRPEKMIASFNDFYHNVLFELPEVGYGGGNKFVLRTTFCSTLPQLFDAFLEEGEDRIANFEVIRRKINELKPRVQRICQREADLEEDSEEEEC